MAKHAGHDASNTPQHDGGDGSDPSAAAQAASAASAGQDAGQATRQGNDGSETGPGGAAPYVPAGPDSPSDRGSAPGDAGTSDTESVIWSGRTSWRYFAGSLIGWFTAAIIVCILIGWLASTYEALTSGVAFWIAAALVVVSGAIVVGRIAVQIYSLRFRLTPERLFIERGLLSKIIDQSELIRVDDVQLHMSLMERIFGLGTVIIISTDASDSKIRIRGIEDSTRVAEAVRGYMKSQRQKRSMFVESL